MKGSILKNISCSHYIKLKESCDLIIKSLNDYKLYHFKGEINQLK